MVIKNFFFIKIIKIKIDAFFITFIKFNNQNFKVLKKMKTIIIFIKVY